MRLLTWLSRDLRKELVALDPASKPRPGSSLSAEDVLARAEEMGAFAPSGESTFLSRSAHKPRRWPALASAAALVLIVATGVLVLSRTSPSRVASGESTVTRSTDPTPIADPGSSTKAAAKLWSSFQVSANPRPVVLVGQDVQLPSGAFPDGDTKIAFIEGRVHLAVAAPNSPATREGYPIISATDAITAMTAPVSPGPVVGTAITTTLQVTSIALTDHAFQTDRGEQSLPAWQIHLDGITGDAYVLAVASSARFPVGTTDVGLGGPASVSADGTEVTIPFVAHQDPARCQPGFTSSLQIAQTSTAIVLATTTTFQPQTTPSTQRPNTDPAPYVCNGSLVGTVAPHEPLSPGEPGTRTLTLNQPLGARAVVDAQGRPYAVVTTN